MFKEPHGDKPEQVARTKQGNHTAVDPDNPGLATVSARRTERNPRAE